MNIFAKNNNPPDLEEWLRGVIKTLKGEAKGRRRAPQFAGNGGGEAPKGGGDDDGFGVELPPLSVVATILGSAAVVLWVFLGFFTVDASEQAVMFRLGNPIGVKEAGLRWHTPLIEDYRIVNVSEVRRVEVGFRNDSKRLHESLMLTGNLNIVDMQFVVQYALNDAERFLFENRFTNARAEDVVQQAAEAAMREVVGKNNIDFVLYEGREAIATETKTAMQKILDNYETGIVVREVAIQNVQPPDQVQDAFEDAIKARQDLDRKINEGKAYANDILPKTAGQAARLRENAEAYKQGKIARAQGEADRFILLATEYQLAPEVTRRRLYLETMEEVMGRANKILIDNVGSGNLLYLPLDRVLQAGAGALIPRDQDGDATPTDFEQYKNRLRRQINSGANELEEAR